MNRQLALIVIVSLGSLVTHAYGVDVGQSDDFQDGTTSDWVVGLGPNAGVPPFPPTNMDGGPNGAGDRYLQLTSTGGAGAGSKMVVINAVQWTGDYLSAGITGIAMDLNNQSGLPLNMRMRFEHFSAPGPPTGDFLSTVPVTLPPQSGWQSVFFPISESDLTDLNLGSGDDFMTTMADVGVVRLVHAPSLSVPADSIDALLGVDNITAVPEPTGLAALASALIFFCFVRRGK